LAVWQFYDHLVGIFVLSFGIFFTFGTSYQEKFGNPGIQGLDLGPQANPTVAAFTTMYSDGVVVGWGVFTKQRKLF
jgi:hypothetical protein